MPEARWPTGRAAPPAADAARNLRWALLLAMMNTAAQIGNRLDPQAIDGRLAADLGATALANFAVACAMLWAIGASHRRLGRLAAPQRLALTVLAGTAAGWLVALPLLLLRSHALGVPTLTFTDHIGLFVLSRSLTIAALLVAAHEFTLRSDAAMGALHEAELRGLRLEREADAAQLQLLQAQVEPHFIFNALANVRRLLRTEPLAARELLGELLSYLEHALPTLRQAHSTLGREIELVRAYLAVYQVRMGERLAAEIDLPPALAHVPVPPMVLLTLVENALKHGLQPLVEGGSIHVSARAESGRITLTVADTGSGMGSGSGHGTGLANLRARLRSMYGSAASLALAVNDPRGVRVTVTLPARAP